MQLVMRVITMEIGANTESNKLQLLTYSYRYNANEFALFSLRTFCRLALAKAVNKD